MAEGGGLENRRGAVPPSDILYNIMSYFYYQFRLYPTQEQAQKINRNIGCARLVYNFLLDDCKKQYQETGKSKIMNLGDVKKREGLEFLNEVDSNALLYARLHLQTAYENFFKNLKKGKVTFPKFHSKKNSKLSYSTYNGKNCIRIEGKTLRLPKIGFVNCRFHRFVEGKIKSATVSQTKTGKYFVSILVEREPKFTERVCDGEKKVLGIDMSIPGFAVYSDGTKPKSFHYFHRSENKLAKQQRRLSKKKLGSKNFEKQRLKVAKIYEKIANQRKDFIEKESFRIAKGFDVVVVEDINLQTMSKNLRFGKSVGDNGFGMFRKRLKSKLEDQLKEFVVADKWFASSKICNVCGYKKADLSLKDREWICPNCGTLHDRDLNAALNLKNYYVRPQWSELKPVEIGNVADKSQDPKKRPIYEAGKIEVLKPQTLTGN